MKIELNILKFAASGAETGYIDLPRALSAVNGKSITQTKRSDGKYKPLGYLIRVRSLGGTTVTVQSLNCGYPTRNAVVLAGHARDEMLKKSGISRGNLESYQKELRLKFEKEMIQDDIFFPGATDVGPSSGGWGNGVTFDYTRLIFDDPDAPGNGLSMPLCVLGDMPADWSTATAIPVIDQWYAWRKSFTPSAEDNMIAENAFSFVINQSSTAEDVVQMIDDSQDEKPYDLAEFSQAGMKFVLSTEVGNPTSSTFCAPLGLLKIITQGSAASWEIEVLGFTEL